MDTSETYIKMCEGAEEIQSQKPEGSQGEFVYCDGEAYQEMDDRPLTPFIWLPRQDQLQEMVNLKIHASWLLLNSFIGWYINEYNESYDWPEDWDSWEKIWLAFVMSQEYEKVWDDENEKWVARVPAKIGV